MHVAHSARVAATLVGLGLATTACTNASTNGESSNAGPSSAATANATVEVDADAAALVPEEIKQAGKITVASDASYAPFEYFDDDNKTIIGFDSDVGDAIAATLGLKASHVNAGFDTILPGLAAGKYKAGMSAFSVTPERSKVVDFVPYLKSGSGLAVAKGNPLDLEMKPESLCGHRIAAQKGSTQAIEQLPDISKSCEKAGKPAVAIRLFPSQNEANLGLTGGRVDGVMADSVPLAYQGQQTGGKFELAPGEDYEPVALGIALPKGSKLGPAMQEALDVLIKDGSYAKILNKWKMPETMMPDSTK